ncbi:MAG: SCO6880 family protein [Acidimicrobiales bacterium]
MPGDGRRYRFGPLERRGLVAGWRGGQIASVTAGLLLAVLALRSRPSAATVAAAVLAVAGGVALAWWPVAGRTGEEWLPTVVRWGTAGRRGRRRLARAPASGHCIGPDGRPCLASAGHGEGAGGAAGRGAPVRPAAAPGPFAQLALLSAAAQSGDEPVGVVLDRRNRTYTAALEVRGHSFALLGRREQDHRVTGWSAVLAALARERSIVHRLQWVATTVPDDGAAVRGYLEERHALPPEAAARRSYDQLLAASDASTCRHDVHLAVQVRATGAGARATRALGGGDRGACAVLLREVAALRRHLQDADVSVERVLDDRALAAVIRRAGQDAPAVATTGDLEGGNAPRCPPCAVGWPWPMALEPEWGCIRADGTWHATYWIAEWPRVDVGPDFMGPLLLGSVRRTVAVVMEPMSPSRAVRQAEQARTADLADEELRRRGGFLSTARRAKEAELAGRREEELADGHSSFRFSGFVTVTAPSRTALAAGCEATEQAAGQSRLELRRLYGDQEQGFASSLPLGLGLR